MAATTSTVSQAIDQYFEPGFIDEVYRYSFLGAQLNGRPLFPAISSNGGTSVSWKIHDTGQTASVYTEGAATAAAGNQTYKEPSQSYVYMRVMTEWTGHLVDALRDPSMYFDAIAAEIQLAQADLMNLANTSFLGSTYGIENIVDSTSTLAGISRISSPSYFSSQEVAHAGVLTLAGLEDLAEILSNASIGGFRPGMRCLLAAPNQCTNYSRLPGVVGASNGGVRVVHNNSGATSLDLGFDMSGLTFQGAPIISTPGLTNTIWILMDATPGTWNLVVHRPFKTDYQGRVGDGDSYAHTFAAALIGRRPRLSGKLTGVTA